jgi:hypothetical protein
MKSMSKSILVMGLVALLSTGCGKNDLTVPDFNNPSVEDLQTNPTPAGIAAAAQGLLFDTRLTVADMVKWVGAFGREVYPMAPTGSSLPGSVRDPWNQTMFVGTSVWQEAYQNIRNVNLLLDALASSELTVQESSAVSGFAKTIQAYEFLHIAVTRRRLGAPIAVGSDPNDPPAAVVSESEVYAHVASLLDAAVSDLTGGGATFPFSLTSGLSDFNTPSTFIQLNRGLKARTEVYRGQWTSALQALSESFLDTNKALNFGAYHDWSTNSGDMVNPANRPDLLWANTRFRTEAQLRLDTSKDLRFQTKFKDVPPYQLLEVQSDLQFTLYEDPGTPFVWVKNEELILLRAEANLGNGDLDQALVDINFIRENSGGLEPLASAGTAAALLDELLYNKRFSLVFEWGHTWIDMNHYGKLLEIPVLGPPSADQRLHDAMPFPLSECLPREPDVPAGCTAQQGFLP